MWLSHWGGSFFYRWSLFSYSLNLVCTQDLLDLQYEVELMYNAKGRKLEAYSLSLWQLESISWDLNIKKQPWMKYATLRNSQWFPVPDELACSQATRSMPLHLWAQVRQRNHPRWNAIYHFMSLTFNFELILYLYKSCQSSKESVHRLLTELPLILSLYVTMLHWAEPGNWHYHLETYQIPSISFTSVFFFMFQYPVQHSTLRLGYVFSVSSNL